MKLFSRAAIGGLLLYSALLAGCGETFRPVATPVISPGGDPQAQKNAVVLSTDGTNEGVTSHINISGDTVVAQVPVGRDPSHLTLFGNSALTLVANRGEDNVKLYFTFLPSLAPPSTVTLSPGAAPSYLFSRTAGQMFVAFTGRNSIGVVNLSNNTQVAEIPLAGGAAPTAITGLADGSKIYTVNTGTSTVSVIRASDNLVEATIAVGAAPAFAVMNAANTRVYVVNRGGNSVSVIDVASNTVTATIPVGAGPNYAVFDLQLLRVYVTNAGGNTLSIINADPLSPSFHAVTNVTVGNNPTSVTALADGSKVYVANSTPFTSGANAGKNGVSVINTLSNTVQTTIITDELRADGTVLNERRPLSLASSSDSSKVVVATRDTVAPTVADPDASAIISIRTSDNSIAKANLAPLVNSSCNPATTACLRFKPTLVVVTP